MSTFFPYGITVNVELSTDKVDELFDRVLDVVAGYSDNFDVHGHPADEDANWPHPLGRKP